MASRAYTMRARADAVAQTRERILAAAFAVAEETMSLELTLDAVAQRAGVGVRTVLRHFGTRDGLFDAVLDAGRAAIESGREAPAGDVDAAVAALMTQYEHQGDFTAHLLGREGTDPRVDRLLAIGREVHRNWARDVFDPWLDRLDPAERDIVTDLLVVATDVSTWKLLRRDRRLSRKETEQRMLRLIDAVLVKSERR